MADITRPHGTLTGPINFAAPVVNPYGLQDAINNAATSFVDIDGDGDLDALIGNNNGSILVQRNTGSATQPAFGAVAVNPYGLLGVGYSANPSFVDIDGDGDLDVFVCERFGNTQFQRNTGSATSPAFATATTNPFGLTDVGSYGRPSFVDIDGDGDLDAFFGIQPGNVVVQINSGTAASPAFAAATTNPYGLLNVGALYASPSFADIDSDGDLDALLGNYAGNTVVQLNTGSATNPRFGTATVNPYGLQDVGFFFNKASLTVVDIDGDGDLDVLIGDLDANITVQLNTANPIAAVTTTTANGRYGVGSVINLRIVFSENVIVTGTPSIALETGSTDRAAVYTSGSGTTTLTFSYTVRAGDTAADLDVFNASALKLNGGSITDAAGNNAVLTLAAPGATGSLGANANFVIDGVAPRGALLPTPAFAAATTNPYGLADVGISASPRFVDIDGDGDLDTLIGNRDGNTVVQLNTGSATSPAFAAATANPYGLVNVGASANPSFVDIDGDGDLDAFIGNKAGNTLVQLNTGSTTSPAFAAAITNPYGLANVGVSASPSFADIDGDGDLDALIGNSAGNTLVQLNTGSRTAPAFAAATTNPYGLLDAGTIASPSFLDIDGDGDLDALIGNNVGNTVVQLNTGSSANPLFAAVTTNPYGLSDVGLSASPSFVDIDGDGDLDALIGNSNGSTVVRLNTASRVAPVNSTTANGSYGVGSVIVLTVAFNEAVIVTGAPALLLETGITDRNATYSGGSGTTTLTFSYSVQAGDISPNLDQFSSTALALNGGTIRDAAGNNAVLTLAAPAGQGSLGANKAIVIDGVAPRGALPSFGPAATNVYGLADVGFFASPELVDINGDGLLDALIGEIAGDTVVRLNTGSATNPAFGAATTNPYGLTYAGAIANPNLADIDGDGDLDALIGNQLGNTVVQLNTGSASAPAFGPATTNPYGLANAGSYANPSLVDINGDGLLDALIGNAAGNTVVQLNTGTTTAPAFGPATANPYGLANLGAYASPSFVDINGDGLLDALIGTQLGNTVVQLNTGTTTAPAFGPATTNPYDLTPVFGNASPSFVDINGDGVLDALIGQAFGITVVSLGKSVAPVTATTANGTYGVGSVITLTVAFNESVIVTGTPTLLLETGATDRTATYASGSGTSTLTFTYTVQAGDMSADLDQFSSNALALSGGTIRDAAGNNAIITLAAPAGQGSLGANKAIVIDGVAPTLAITSNVAAVKIGETATITFTFSEDPGASFVPGDITTTGGTLGAFGAIGLTRTATFTPAVNTTANASITVAAGTYTDAVGNLGSAGTTPVLAIDTLRPSATVVVADTSLTVGETSGVTITFNEAVTGFTLADLTVANGTLSALATADGGITWSATLTPSANTVAATNNITLDNAGIADLAGNTGTTTTASNTYAVETTRPAFASASASGTTLVMNYTDASNLNGVNIPAVGDFAVTTGGAANSVTAVAVNAAAKTVTLSLTTAMTFGQYITVAYTDPTAGDDANAIQDAAGNDAANLSATAATNNTAAPPVEEPSLDIDGDGVPTAQENLVRPLTPGGQTGDGNGDGVLDSGQVNVTSAPVTENRFITVVADSNKGITDADPNQAVITNFKSEAPPANLPGGASLSNAISFNATIGGTGQTDTFSIFVDASANPNGYWVKTGSGVWNNIATSIETVGDKVRVDFAITDGGMFDADGLANGSIAVTGGVGNLPLTLVGQPPDLPPGGSFWF